METIPWASQNTNWKNTFGTHDKTLIPLIYKELLSKPIQNHPNLTWEKDMDQELQQRKDAWPNFSK